MKNTASSTEITAIWNKNFICVMIATTLMSIGNFSVTPFIASYTKYLGTSDRMTGFLAGMFFGVAFAFRPISGPLITKLDKRILLIFTFVCGCVATLGYAFFRNVPLFVVFRFIHGIEYSFLGTLIMTLASDNLPIEKMASGMGIYTVGSAIGTAAAPAAGTSLLEYGARVRTEGFGYTLVFLLASIALALAIIPAALLSPDRKTKDDIHSTGKWYKNIVTRHSISLGIILMMVQIPYSLYNTYMVEFGKEMSITGVSAFFTVLALVLAVSRPLSGVITDRLGANKVIIPGLIVLAASFFIIGSSRSLWMVLIGSAVAAIGFSLSQPPVIAISMLTETPLKRGVASNTVYLGIDLGLFIGPLFGAFVYERSNYPTMFKFAMIPTGLALISFLLIVPGINRRQAALESETVGKDS